MNAPKIQRERVIQTALTLLDQEGLEGLTMRKLALALQIQAPSLYWHFENKQALIDGMADALLDQVARQPSDEQSWAQRLRSLAAELRQALKRHRDGARVFAGTYVVTDNVMRTSEALIGACIQAGASPSLAATASFSLTYYVLGLVMEEQALGPGSNQDLAARQRHFLTTAQGAYPHNWQARETLFSQDFDSRFDIGLGLFIAGLQQRIAAGPA